MNTDQTQIEPYDQTHDIRSTYLRDRCRGIIERAKVFDFFYDVIVGNPVDKKYRNVPVKNIKGGYDLVAEMISCPAEIRDRIKVSEILLDRGYGKLSQTLDITVGDTVDRDERRKRLFNKIIEIENSDKKEMENSSDSLTVEENESFQNVEIVK